MVFSLRLVFLLGNTCGYCLLLILLLYWFIFEVCLSFVIVVSLSACAMLLVECIFQTGFFCGWPISVEFLLDYVRDPDVGKKVSDHT